MTNDSTKLDNGFFQRSDGLWQNGDGWFAVVMLTKSGETDEFQFFNYRPDFRSETVSVRWALETDIAILPHAVTVALIRRGYARTVTETEMATVTLAAPEGSAPGGTPPSSDGNAPTDDKKVKTQPDPNENGRAETKTRGEPTKVRKPATKPKATKSKTATRKKPADK